MGLLSLHACSLAHFDRKITRENKIQEMVFSSSFLPLSEVSQQRKKLFLPPSTFKRNPIFLPGPQNRVNWLPGLPISGTGPPLAGLSPVSSDYHRSTTRPLARVASPGMGPTRQSPLTHKRSPAAARVLSPPFPSLSWLPPPRTLAVSLPLLCRLGVRFPD